MLGGCAAEGAPIRPRPLVLVAVAAALAGGTGCAAKIDRLTLDHIVGRALDYPDLGKVCAMGEALAHPLGALTMEEPHRALAVAEGVAALCGEQGAWEAELASARAKKNLTALGEARAAEITDARILAARGHAEAAARFELAWRQAEAAFGEYGGDCPAVPERDQFAYLFGLVSGTLALLHDKSAGSPVNVPMDRLSLVARGAACLDDDRWWHAPTALRAAAWATVPGSGPADVDAWRLLDDAAAAGERSGVRVARAIEVLIAANSGRDDVLGPALAAHAASLATTPTNPDWALLDAYATAVSQHQADLLWTARLGHRAEALALPPEPAAAPAPGGSDPFGADPFGAPAEPPPTPAEPPPTPAEPPPTPAEPPPAPAEPPPASPAP